MLKKFKNGNQIFEHRVLAALIDKLEEYLEDVFYREVFAIDLAAHCIASVRVQIMKLFIDFLDGCLSCSPLLRIEACDKLDAEELNQISSFGL